MHVIWGQFPFKQQKLLLFQTSENKTNENTANEHIGFLTML